MNKKTIVKSLLLWKQRIGYSSTYFSLISIPLLVVNLVQEKLLLINIKVNFLVLFLLCSLLICIFGYVLDKFGFWELEANIGYEKNTLLRDDINGKQRS